ncbi:MAG: hypothetical protein IKG22_06775 [Atopobiaceae bacterium]|nr:hypothetical protein [Atopobiaceae bacterium]
MITYTEAPTVLVFWRGQRTADALSAATKGLRAKHTICSTSMVCKRHKRTGGDAA